jgi:CheY-like chemotaxis protein
MVKILFVESSPLTGEVLARRLERRGYRVACVGDGEGVLDKARDEAPDLILLDLSAEAAAGLEAARQLKALPRMRAVPIIGLTARASADEVPGGCCDALEVKSFDLAPLSRKITDLLGKTKGQGEDGPRPPAAREAAVSLAGEVGCRVAPRVQPRPSAFKVEPFSATGRKSGDSLCQPRPPSSYPDLLPEEPGTMEWGDTWPMDNMRLAGYEILGELGRGGMGVVYKARHLCMNRVVALKVIDQEHLARPRAIERFYREVQAAAQLSHRNIVMAFDAGELGETHYFAMEFVPGFDLVQLMEERGPLPVGVACHLIAQAAQGLQHAHERGLVHRDIKPSNLLITWERPPPPVGGWEPGSAPPLEEAVVKILDLGLALLDDGGDGEGGGPAEGRAVGTADYMAPEQWANAHKVDVRADLYSLGATFYHLLTGQVPFPADEPMEKMLKHHLDEPVPVSQFRPDVPPDVAALVRRLMAKQPGQRFQLAEEVVRALAEVRLP